MIISLVLLLVSGGAGYALYRRHKKEVNKTYCEGVEAGMLIYAITESAVVAKASPKTAKSEGPIVELGKPTGKKGEN